MQTVVIDARGYFTGGGIGRYTRNLVRELVRTHDGRTRLRLLISKQHQPADLDPSIADGADVVVSDAAWLDADEENRWLEGEVAGADLFHSLTGHWLPRETPSVATLHDLTATVRPRLTGEETRAFGKRVTDSVARARHVVAVSGSTARDARRTFGRRTPPITVIPEAAEPLFRPQRSRLDVLSRYHVNTDGYLLAVSALSPHKNLVRLINAYAVSSVRVPLLLAGAERADTPRIRQTIADRGLQHQVSLIGCVSDDDLAMLYSGCRAFVYPSLYEGFGLPVLEAMACGAAVVASRSSSIPEIVGDAALLVDPERTRSLAAALVRIDSDAPLRVGLRHRALIRAASFSWPRTAAATRDVYARVLKGRAA